MQSHLADFEKAGASIWAISADDPARLASFRAEQGIEFEFLLDPEGTTFEAYGILNERADRTVPHPTVIVVDGKGTAQYVSSDENYKLRPSTLEVVRAAQGLSD